MNNGNMPVETEKEEKGAKMFGLTAFALFGVTSLIFCIPAIVALILYFTVPISIWWFIGICIGWVVYWVVYFFMVLFGRWGQTLERETANQNANKNPYSHVGPVETKKGNDNAGTPKEN
ncbi:MAG: hypothetical protein IJU52_00320 [Clostridia bacterium]|nr:hypothetical protein [Clostridia bacterium]